MAVDRSQILAELRDAARAREEARRALTEAQERFLPARARVRASREWKALVNAKGSIRLMARELAAAIERHDAIEAELFTGETGFPLFDRAPKSNCKPATAGRAL
jgi:hypothetical protein